MGPLFEAFAAWQDPETGSWLTINTIKDTAADCATPADRAHRKVDGARQAAGRQAADRQAADRRTDSAAPRTLNEPGSLLSACFCSLNA